jgi:hypothetical protein
MEKGSYKEERRKLRESFLQVVETDKTINSIGEKDNQTWPGSFVAARPLQEQMITVEGTHDRNQAEICAPPSVCVLGQAPRHRGERGRSRLRRVFLMRTTKPPETPLYFLLAMSDGMPIEWAPGVRKGGLRRRD